MDTLYRLTGQLLELQELMEGGDVDEQVLLDTMEAVGGELEVKAEGYGCVIRNLEAQAEALKDEEERLGKRRRSIESNISWLKRQLLSSMQVLEKPKIKGLKFTFFVKNNPPKAVVTDQAKVPWNFLKTTQVNDLAAIKEFLTSDEGRDCEWAHLEVGQSLQMR